MTRILLVLGIFGIVWEGAVSNTYDDHTLIRLITEDATQLEAASHFQDPENEVEVLKTSRGVNDTLDVLVPQNRMQFVKDFAKSNDLSIVLEKIHYGRTFEDLTGQRSARRRVMQHFVFQYHSFAQIQDYLEMLASRHSDVMTLQSIGNSYQGRKQKLVKISAQPNKGNPIIFVDAGIHSREWVAPAMALYLISRLVTDTAARKSGAELDGVDWYILPVVNPDGYEYTRSERSNRMWRKTRSHNGNCYGVDGNRNYGYKWAVSGVSLNPCHMETYAGPRAFSEPETQMVRNVMMENAKRIKLYVSLHSYGQYLVYPWGYTGDFLPKQWQKLDSLARKVSDKVVSAGGSPFRVMSAGKWYAAAGGSDDYAFAVVGIPYSYTMELTAGYEFNFPEHLLREVLPQYYEGFRAFGTHIRNEFSKGRKKREISYGS